MSRHSALALSWVALVIGGCCWLSAAYPVPRRADTVLYIQTLYLSVAFGTASAVASGLALRVVRVGGSSTGLAWVALITNLTFLYLAISRVLRAFAV